MLAPAAQLSSLVLLVSAYAGRGEGARDTLAVAVDTIVVTAPRSARSVLDVPAAIDRIAAADLRRASPGLALSEFLGRVPGVLARDRQNQAQDLQLSIRGFGARS